MLRISQSDYDVLRKHGVETYPYECCGVLLGTSEDGINTVTAIMRVANIRTDSAHNRYQIAPQELIHIQREARQRELDIIGFYHSHPDHPAQWSKTDFVEAHWFGCSYVITSVCKENARCRAFETNAFLLTGFGQGEEDKRFEDEHIQVEPIQNEAIAVAATVDIA